MIQIDKLYGTGKSNTMTLSELEIWNDQNLYELSTANVNCWRIDEGRWRDHRMFKDCRVWWVSEIVSGKGQSVKFINRYRVQES